MRNYYYYYTIHTPRVVEKGYCTRYTRRSRRRRRRRRV